MTKRATGNVQRATGGAVRDRTVFATPTASSWRLDQNARTLLLSESDAQGWVVQVGDTTTLLAHGAISTSGLGLAEGQQVSVRAESGMMADAKATVGALGRGK